MIQIVPGPYLVARQAGKCSLYLDGWLRAKLKRVGETFRNLPQKSYYWM